MPSCDGPVLEAAGVRRSYGRARILQGIDLVLHRGDALVVVGPNGAGKTTLLRVFAGLNRPTAGEIRLLGRRLDADAVEARRAIGFVSHQSLLYDDLTLEENLAFAARLYGLQRPAEVARRALAEVGLDARRADSPRRLSRGMLQRAAVARALLHDPALVLLDEPFTGLDTPAAERLREMLAARLARGVAAVVVTHQPAEAWELATRVVALVGGRWALDEPRRGSPAEFLAQYQALLSA